MQHYWPTFTDTAAALRLRPGVYAPFVAAVKVADSDDPEPSEDTAP